MKKLIFVALLALISITTFSQAKFGVKAGLNVANLTGDDTDDVDARISGVFGVFAKVSISETIAFQPEVLYSMQGYTSTIIGDFEGSAVNYKDDTKLHYLNIPIMLRYNYKGIFAEVGPQFGINLRNTLDYEVELDYYGNNVTFSDRLKDIAKTFDFGVGVGLGYEIPKTNLNVNARYMFSLTSFYTDAGTTSGGYQFVDNESGSPKNRVLSFSLGYKF